MIIIYGKEGCSGCESAKQYLYAIGEQYEYKDLSTSNPIDRIEWKKEVHSLGIKMIPAIYIDDNPVIIGFNEDKINEYLSKR